MYRSVVRCARRSSGRTRIAGASSPIGWGSGCRAGRGIRHLLALAAAIMPAGEGEWHAHVHAKVGGEALHKREVAGRVCFALQRLIDALAYGGRGKWW